MKRRDKASSEPQVLRDHVNELRKRLLVCAIVLVAAGALGYVFFDQILAFLKAPLHAGLYYNSPAGSFGFVMKVCTMVGIGLALPVIIYNLVLFLQPAFREALSPRRVFTVTFMSIVLAVSGAAFGYYLIIPGALKFFAGFQVDGLSALITADSYLSFVTSVIITFILVFQIPLLMMLIDRIKPIPPKKLFKWEKYVVIAGLVVSIIVPFAFDLVTCLLIAAPIIVLYNLSIALIMWQHAAKKRAAKIAAEFVMPTSQLLSTDATDMTFEQFFDTPVETEMAKEPFEQVYKQEIVHAEVVETTAKPATVQPIATRRKSVKMDFYSVNKTSLEKMQRAIVDKRNAVAAERAARRAAVPTSAEIMQRYQLQLANKS